MRRGNYVVRREYWTRESGSRVYLRASANGSRLHVCTPYSPDFAQGAKRLGGRWKLRARVWSFPGDKVTHKLVLAMVLEIFPDHQLSDTFGPGEANARPDQT